MVIVPSIAPLHAGLVEVAEAETGGLPESGIVRLTGQLSKAMAVTV